MACVAMAFAGLVAIRTVTAAPLGPSVGTRTTNLSRYPNGQVPRYAKFEVTFDVTTVAQNLQLPYDASPPPGVEPEIGVTVNGLFSPDGWQTVYTQPAFYYQEFLDEVKSGKEWFYPTGDVVWKLRFAPHQVGTWQYKIIVEDADGRTETAPASFTVGTSNSKGFVRVSSSDSRYFEFEDGTYFPGLGYNMNYDHVSWVNPVLDNQENFRIMGENGIQLARIWLSQWAIYGSEWNPWMSPDPALHGQYLPYTGLEAGNAAPGSEMAMRLTADYNPCMFVGAWKAASAVKRNTDYRVRIRYKASAIAGPRVAGQPFGFTAKTGGWLWGAGTYCQDPGAGTAVTPHQVQDTGGWTTLEGTFNSGERDFLPNFHLVLDNVTAGIVFVDYVWVEEVLGGGEYGPNLISKPWMDHHRYMEQRNSYAFDKVLELAEQHGVYLRPVLLEKNERILNRIDYEGAYIPYDPVCFDKDPDTKPERCWGNQWFYGNWRKMTKVRWLQQAWWRYVQARWGYSTHIHSWELLNEGDPFNGPHHTLADEFGKYMHQFKPNDHLVSTSTWHSFPRDEFWASADYPNVDFADLHRYVGETDPLFEDTAQATYAPSMQYGAKQPGGAGKPVIRGETGFVMGSSEPATSGFASDTDAIWLHNLIWGGINPGGMIESYWYETDHIYKKNRDGTYQFDHRDQYGVYAGFIQNIQLNNGHYQDAQATATAPNLRVWGQKDLVNGCAHLWIQNQQHTWQNAVARPQIAAVSGVVTVAGFQPETAYTVEWWDTYPNDTRQIMATTRVTSDADGAVQLQIEDLDKDIAVKVITADSCGAGEPAGPEAGANVFLPLLSGPE